VIRSKEAASQPKDLRALGKSLRTPKW
jgi:hypothetical protein